MKVMKPCEICGRLFEEGQSLANHKKWHDPDYRRRCNQHKFGKKFSQETRKKLSLTKRGSKNPSTRPDVREKISNSVKEAYEESNKYSSDGYLEKIAEKTRQMWKDGKYVKKQMKSRKVRPNGFEKRIMNIVEKHGLPFSYVGDGKEIIGGKCPDFVHDSLPIAVEALGIFWHLKKPRYKKGEWSKDEEEEKYKDHYSEFGYSFIPIWEDETDSTILNKLS